MSMAAQQRERSGTRVGHGVYARIAWTSREGGVEPLAQQEIVSRVRSLPERPLVASWKLIW